MNPNEFGVASGWYPDPLGLPQLRWWDGQGWAEHTSEARAPIVEQVSTAANSYAAGAFPSRRATRERERAEFEKEFEGDFDDDYDDSDVVDDLQPISSRGDSRDERAIDSATAFDSDDEADTGTVDYDVDDDDVTLDPDLRTQGLLEMTLKEFEPPLEQDADATGGVIRGAGSTFDAGAVPAPRGALDPARFRPPTRPLHSYTVSAWLLSVIPLLQLITILLLVPVAGLGNNWPLVISAWVAPHLIAVGLAAHDRLTLMLWDHRNPASPRWALLMAVGYLIVRSRRVRRETGHGSPLLLIVGLSFAALFAACVAVPGLVISVAPTFFVGEIEAVVTADARAVGASIAVV